MGGGKTHKLYVLRGMMFEFSWFLFTFFLQGTQKQGLCLLLLQVIPIFCSTTLNKGKNSF